MQATKIKSKRVYNIIKKVFIFALIAAVCVSVINVYSPNITENETVTTLSKLGSRGEEVRRVQQKLKSLGYYTGKVDGIYGVQTQKAVRAFQKNCGITVDGIAGSKTLLFLGLSGGTSSSKYSSADINLLARLISAEARGESYTGQVAVGAVVLNRVSHPSFPDSISGVIYQAGAFSCLNDSNWYAAVSSSARQAAQDAINGWDPSGGAIYYFNPAKTSNSWMWSRPLIVKIGNHRFCS